MERHAVKIHELVESRPLARRLLQLANAVEVSALLESTKESLDIVVDLLPLLQYDQRRQSMEARAYLLRAQHLLSACTVRASSIVQPL